MMTTSCIAAVSVIAGITSATVIPSEARNLLFLLLEL
jgi:hypothetical protein